LISKVTDNNTITGIKWNFIRALSQIFLSFFVGIILARLIDPADFGLFAITLVFIGFSAITSSIGVTQALIQRKRISQRSKRVSMTLTIITGALFYILFWFIAPFISGFFDIRELTLIIRIVSLIFISKGFSSYSRAMLIRYLRFRKIFIIEISSYIFGYSLVSITMAAFNYGVWSLVGGTLGGEIISLVLLLYFIRLPGKPLLEKEDAKRFLQFGGWVSVSAIFNYLANSLDNLIIGKNLTSRSLGFYNKAFQLMKLPLRNVAIPISEVLFPSYSSFQENILKVKKAYHRSINAVSLISYPILTSMAVCSKYIIVGLYGPNWEGAINIFRILSIAGIFRLVINLSGPVTKATGNIFAEAWRQFVYLFMVVTGSLLVVRYGIEFVGFAVLTASLIFYLLMAGISIKILKTTWKDFFRSQLPGIYVSIILFIASSAFIFLIERYLTNLSMSFLLICLALALSIIYIILILFLPDKIRGTVPAWFYGKYKSNLPVFLNRILKKCFRSSKINE